ncbi:MAG: hypothetical protein M1550_07435 [Deltaproteobacteria bacterium]|nr:hypothetical protein [Deltaproteobacteria bacterium]
MLFLRRVFIDGPDRPEIVLLHYTASPTGSPGTVLSRSTVVVPPGHDGRREVILSLPEPPSGGIISVRYFFSVVRSGAEWFSPVYEIALPGAEAGEDLSRLPETGGGNLPPAAGLGFFRLVLPLRGGVRRSGAARYGFGAMRKKPTPELCRAAVPLADGRTSIVEVPEALAVLKNRPMPYFLHHLAGEAGDLASDKINSARITCRDECGDVLCARLLWADPSWAAPNLSVMELRNFPTDLCRASGYFFAEDRAAWISARSAVLTRVPLPRTFEAYVYGPAGSTVEYCFQLLRRDAGGRPFTEWRNHDGGNFRVTL